LHQLRPRNRINEKLIVLEKIIVLEKVIVLGKLIVLEEVIVLGKLIVLPNMKLEVSLPFSKKTATSQESEESKPLNTTQFLQGPF